MTARLPLLLMLLGLGAGVQAGFQAQAQAQEQAQDETASVLRGVVRAVHEAAISSEVPGAVVELPFREGASFRKGDRLIAFDCAALQAERDAAEAERKGELAAWENVARLYKLRAAGAHEVTLAAAGHEKAAAQVKVFDVKLSRCAIAAPFDGRVVSLATRPYETPRPGEPLIRILDDSALEIDTLLPAALLKETVPGRRFRIALDNGGPVLMAEFIRIGATIDVVSQTFRATAQPVGNWQGVLPGMSGSLTFDPAITP
jgi:membrane fusion protein, multidrug efflux system